MAPELIGLIGILALLGLLTLGVPIGVSLALTGVVGLMVMLSPEAALVKAGVVVFEVAQKYELGVLPLFLLMAHLCFAAGASRDFFDVAARFVGHRRGGLGLASIAGCAGFGAISGSSLATVATVGSAALPEMRRAGYNPGFAAGALAAGGTLGALIPPSGALIVFGIIAEVSIGRLFTAAIIPGFSQALFYMIAIAVLCWFKPELGPRSVRVGWGERMRGLLGILDILVLVVFVIGGLMIGWFTPTEAASVGVIVAFILIGLRGAFNRSAIADSFAKTLSTTGMIYLIIFGAILFATFISVTGIADLMSTTVRAMDASPVIVVIVIALMLLVLGSFLDGLALMLLTTPIFLPIVLELGYSPIWFGIFLVRTMEIGFVHPPLGLNVYVIQAIGKDIPLGQIFRGIVPFLIADFFHLAMIIAFPVVTLWLPSVMGA
ncbi:tripartite ATP-independent transporter DctM subunit [Sphingomonas sp. BE123]|uniref:TRAP transporter large permease n=1 Tax=Sphingomonas sp. BE123 TaxID=2817842 RepID=UPI0028670F4C|nr:TRAP transporter large permease [Sphingomonas sp. BE123]MDR6850543.1 tripartite ATP-independent transporter DctM subunit [Sphingomonas sp. BE123]